MKRSPLSLLLLLSVLAGCASAPVKKGPEGVVERVEGMLASMTVEEKVGQVMMGYFDGPALSGELLDRIKALHLGGVILYSKTGNVESPRQVAALTGGIQQAARDAKLPALFVAIDQEGGNVVRLTKGVTVFPSQMALGATGNETLAASMATVTARELRTLGINFNFAPVVDVNSNPDNPVIGTRSFGSSPSLVARLGAAMVPAYAAEKVVCSAKHFPGHGDTSVDSHVGLPQVSADRAHLEAVEWVPFKAMIEAGVPAIMTAHVVVPALAPEPGTLSPVLLSALRKDLGFQGLIVTDSMTMGAISKHWGLPEASIRALSAGADLLLYGADVDHAASEQQGIFEALVKAVREGRVPLARLNEAARRNLLLKAKYGILDDPMPRPEGLGKTQNALAEQIAEDSLTLLANEQLPLNETDKIPVLWPDSQPESLDILLADCPQLEERVLPADLSDEMVKELAASFQGPVIVGLFDLAKHQSWITMFDSLK
ncbi:MAG: glycoside hydrolase family 3 protein [Bacteroidota bacterium]